jgi:hypothetical protein
MGFRDRLTRRKDRQGGELPQPESSVPVQPVAAPRILSLEGTSFPLFDAEAPFIQECRRSGSAALRIPFSEFWPTFGRALQGKAMTGAMRLLCMSCVVDMPNSFRFSLPGGLGSSTTIVAVGATLPGNLPAAAKAAQCPYCGSDVGILVSDNPSYGEIGEQDAKALRDLWRFRSQVWWTKNDLSEEPPTSSSRSQTLAWLRQQSR